jgi:hypothetical protein
LTAELGPPEAHASNHGVVLRRWLIEREMMSVWFVLESGGALLHYLTGGITIRELYEQWDRVLDDEMAAEDGNAFLRAYVGGPVDRCSRDDGDTLNGGLPSELHARCTESNHQAMRAVIDRRYAGWRETGMAGRRGM